MHKITPVLGYGPTARKMKSQKYVTFDGKEESWILFKKKAKSFFQLQKETKGVLNGALATTDNEYDEKNENLYHALIYGLEGEALHVISEVTEGDGLTAWKKLEERYDTCGSTSKMEIRISNIGLARSLKKLPLIFVNVIT